MGILIQLKYFIQDAKTIGDINNIKASCKRIYGDKIPEYLQKAIDEKQNDFNNNGAIRNK